MINGNKIFAKYIREHLHYKSWRSIQLKRNGGRCWVTGKSVKVEVHHYNVNFHVIIKEVLKKFGFSNGVLVRDIPSNKLEQMVSLFVYKHRHAKGVPLSKRVHKEFHKRYGKKDNTIDQLRNFKIDLKD